MYGGPVIPQVKCVEQNGQGVWDDANMQGACNKSEWGTVRLVLLLLQSALTVAICRTGYSQRHFRHNHRQRQRQDVDRKADPILLSECR